MRFEWWGGEWREIYYYKVALDDESWLDFSINDNDDDDKNNNNNNVYVRKGDFWEIYAEINGNFLILLISIEKYKKKKNSLNCRHWNWISNSEVSKVFFYFLAIHSILIILFYYY